MLHVVFRFVWLMVPAFMFVYLARDIASMRRRLARIRQTSRQPIAASPRSGTVEIEGSVVAEAGAARVAPLSGLPVVYSESRVYESHGSSRRNLVTHTVRSAFLVDDGSGVLARIDLTDTSARVEPSELDRAVLVDKDKEALALLAEHKHTRESAAKLSWEESILAPGMRVYALGEAFDLPGGPAPAGYRDEPGRALGVRKGASGELFVAVGSEGEVEAKLRLQIKLRVVMMFASVIFAAFGFFASD